MRSKYVDKLYYLRVLAEEQNITRAAERLFVSQPALTAYLNRLESSLGVRLFDRSTTPIRVTAAGRYYISEMQKIEYQEGQLLENLKDMDFSQDITLVVGIGRNRGGIWLPHILPEVYRRFPDAHIKIVEDRDESMAEKVVHDALDVAIIESFIYIGALAYLQLPDELHTLVTGYDNPEFQGMDIASATRHHPLDVPVPLVNRQLFICPSIRGTLDASTQQLFQTFRLSPREILFIANNVTSYQLAVGNLGIAYLNVNYADVFRTEGKPLFIMPGGKPAIRKLYAIYKDTKMTELKRFFISCTDEVMRKVLR